MSTARGVFLASAAFGIVVAVVYWFSSYHPGGTLLLALMGVAMIFAATFMLTGQRATHLPSDRPSIDPKETAGEEVGTFTIETVWPIVAALGVLTLLVGVIFSPFVAGVGVLICLIAMWHLGLESNRN